MSHIDGSDELDAIYAQHLRRQTTRLCADPPADPMDFALQFRRRVSSWWRMTRIMDPTDVVAKALADCASSVAAAMPANPRWDGVMVLARDAAGSDPNDRIGAMHALLTAIGVPPDITEWDEAIGDWANMTHECRQLPSAEVASLLLGHLRWTISIVAYLDTPADMRPVLVEAALAGLARVARMQGEKGLHDWSGLEHVSVVMDGQDAVARAAHLAMYIDDLTSIAEGAS